MRWVLCACAAVVARAKLDDPPVLSRHSAVDIRTVRGELLELDWDEYGFLKDNVVLAREKKSTDALVAVIGGFEAQLNGVVVAQCSSNGCFEMAFPGVHEDVDVVALRQWTKQEDVGKLYDSYFQDEAESEEPDPEKAILGWLVNLLRVEVGFHNTGETPLKLYWLEPQRVRGNFNPIHVADISPAETSFHMATIGHQFSTKFENGTVDETVQISCDSVFRVGHAIPSSRLGTRERITQQELNALFRENDERAKSAPVYTPGCILVQQAPAELMADLRRFFYSNEVEAIPEVSDSVVTNWWEVETDFLPVGPELTKKWSAMLAPTVEEWIDRNVDIGQHTTGFRTHKKGAKIRPHVGREHWVSALVTLGESAEANWKFMLFRDEAVEELVPKVGEVVLFESGRCAHARPFELEVDRTTTILFHFSVDQEEVEQEQDAEEEVEQEQDAPEKEEL